MRSPLPVILLAAAMSSSQPAAAPPRTSGVLTINGTPHPYLAEGSGLTCIVVGPALSYVPLFSDALKQRIRFVFVDFKHTWSAESAGPMQTITMDTLVDEVDQVRNGLGLDRVCLIGHSAPGLVATEYSLRHPDHVSQVVLVGVEPYFNPEYLKARSAFWETDASAERKAAYQRNVARIPDDLLRQLTPRDAFALRYVRNGPRYFYEAGYDCYWMFAGRSFSAELVSYFLNTIIATYDPRPRLMRNTVPILLVLGRYDYNIPYREWDSARKATPHLTSYVFDRSAHFPMIEERDHFDRIVISWLAHDAR
jgi:proline iminopeptidase